MAANSHLSTVTTAIDRLVASADPHDGLFPSVLDRETGEMLSELPPAVPGQRDCDRALDGCNLIHDQPVLRTMYALADVDYLEYADAADRYLERFATHCTETPNGLFPWGEHAFWHLREDRIGDSYAYHDHWGMNRPVHHQLRQVPLWLWQRLASFDAECVSRFADGLAYHWTDESEPQYCRHALIADRDPPEWGPIGRSVDLPRTSGVFIFDWAFAYEQTGNETYCEQLEQMTDYWWTRRGTRPMARPSRLGEEKSASGPGATGLLAHESEGKTDRLDADQTLGVAAILYESAELLDGKAPSLADTLRDRAAVYAEGFLSAPHDPAAGQFVRVVDGGTGSAEKLMPTWGGSRFDWIAACSALHCLCVYRRTKDDRLLAWAKQAARWSRDDPIPTNRWVHAMDPGLVLGLFADLYDLTGDETWLADGHALADRVTDLYLDVELPRGATNIHHYENQLGTGYLLHGLARLALLEEYGDDCPLGPDYTVR